MNISDLLDSQIESSSLNSNYNTQLHAKSLQEVELLQEIAKLLFKTKSVLKTINIISRINQCTDIVEVHSLPKSQIIFGFDYNKPIGNFCVLDKRGNGIKHNLFGMNDDFNIKINNSVKNNYKDESLINKIQPSEPIC